MTLNSDVPLKLVLSMLVNALDGGINYWVRRKTFSFSLPEDFTVEALPWVDADDWAGVSHSYFAPLVEGGKIEFNDLEGVPCLLDFAAIQRGLPIMARDYPVHYADLMSPEDRADARTADVLVQCSVFGKLVYG